MNDLRKLILKETHHGGNKNQQPTGRDNSAQMAQFLQAIPLYNKLKNLTTLVLSRVSVLGRQSVNGLAAALGALPTLKYLDISYNNLSSHDLSVILEHLYTDDACKLRSLNLAGNNAYHAESRSLHSNNIDKFSDRLQKLLKSSITLQHLDLSCLNMDES